MDPKNNEQVPQSLEQFPETQQPQGLPQSVMVASFVFALFLSVAGMLLYIFSAKNTVGKNDTTAQTKAPIVSAVQMTTEYTNPFDGTTANVTATQTQNPFAAPQTDNPFANLSQ